MNDLNVKHKYSLKRGLSAGEAIWNEQVDEVVGLIHAIGPNYQGKFQDQNYFDTIETTFKSIQRELKNNTTETNIALPLIASSIFKPRDLDLDTYMKFYIQMIHKYLNNSTVYLNLYSQEEKDAFRKAK